MENQKVFYCNNLELNISLYDFIFNFNLKTPAENNNTEEELNDSVKVIMSPQHAKALMVIVNKNVEFYEKNFGVITLPDNMVNKLSAN